MLKWRRSSAAMESCLHFINTQKGSKEDCSNYRGVSVTNVMSRLYGKILRDLIEEENKDEEEQSGFRTGRSCRENTCMKQVINTLWTGDADLRLYITTVQDG